MSEATVRVTLQTPRPPNFIRSADGQVVVPVQDLDDKTLREIGKRWTNLLLMLARNRRAAERQP